MIRRSRFPSLALAVALAVPALALLPAVASGEPKSRGTDDRYDPDNVVAISLFMETVAKGTERFRAKDVTGAIDAYKKATQLSPRNPLGHYLLAEVYLSQGNFGEAEPALKQAQEVSDSKNPSLRSRVLFLSADMKERQKKWAEAKTAWQAYAEHAAKFADAGAFPQTAAERLKAIQKVLDGEAKMVAVRERIAAEKSAAKDAGAPPPAKKK